MCSVPQRLNLGPVLFIVYVNDITTLKVFNFILFADDTTILYWQENIETQIDSKKKKKKKEIIAYLLLRASSFITYISHVIMLSNL